MNNITLTVNKEFVYSAIAKISSYAGDKMVGDDDAYMRIFTTDEDQLMLERFWKEACNVVIGQIKPFIVSVNKNPDSSTVQLANNFVATLEMSSAFDTSLTDNISSSLTSFFIDYIIHKWYKFTNKAEAEGYLIEANNFLDDIMQKLYYRKKPKRVIPV